MRIKLALSAGLIVTALAASGCWESASSQAAADSAARQQPPSEPQLKRQALKTQVQPPAWPLQVERIYPRPGQENRAGLREAFFVRY